MDRQLYTEIKTELCKIPLIDVHTHMDASHVSARGLHDVLLYHMVISDLYSAGCPDGVRLSDEPSEEEAERRVIRALPYIRHIRNTSCYWGLRTLLRGLYGWEDDINEDNWRRLDIIIRSKFVDKNWGRDVLRKSGIRRVNTELWRGRGGICGDIFQYSLEWSFFTRSQWGMFDTALLELEHAWNQDIPGAPLDVTVDRSKLNFTHVIRGIDDVAEAVRHYCDRIPYGEIVSVASHFSTDITYRKVTLEQMIKALKNRNNAGVEERDVYANYINELYYKELSNKNRNIVLNYSLGAEPLPFETGSKLRTETVFELAELFNRYGNLRFSLFVSSLHQNQALCTLARELPNVSLSGYWWHNFFPTSMRQVMAQRLDMLPMNKQVGFFSDAYCADWAYAKAEMVRAQLAEVLADKIAQGQYTFRTAMETAWQILFITPQTLCGMAPFE